MVVVSAFVGRVGGLAVALGVGAVVCGAGVAAADSTEASGSAGEPEPAATERSRDSGAGTTRRQVVHSPVAAATQARNAVGEPGQASTRKSGGESKSSRQDRNFLSGKGLSEPSRRIPGRPVIGEIDLTQTAPIGPSVDHLVQQPQTFDVVAVGESGVIHPVAAAGPPALAESMPAAVESVWSPLPDSDPSAPAESPGEWSVLAAARRELGRSRTEIVAVGAMASAADADPISRFFNNTVPIVYGPYITGHGTGGVVTGSLGAGDHDGDVLTYSVERYPSFGSVTLNSDGGFTYTPDLSLSATGVVDSFSIAVSDATSGFHIHGLAGLINLLTFGLIGSSWHTVNTNVTVTVQPWGANTSPVISTYTLGSPSSSGALSGRVIASDADNDPLTYSFPTNTAKGSITSGAQNSDGTFKYTPTTAALNAAASPTATPADKADTFVVTVTDGRGGVATGSVTVPIGKGGSAANSAPVLGGVSLSSPDSSTGVVSGQINATDIDGDTLSYSAMPTSTKGSVTVNVNTGAFTYTPTASARQNAGKVGATAADKSDTLIVTVTDTKGASASIEVSVPISPSTSTNSPPVAGTPTVGTPNPTTGVVTGQINATDPDGDTLTYTGTTTTSKGNVVVSAATGAFTYTPTDAARQNASAPTATSADKSDSFMATISDGHGGSTSVSVVVAIGPGGSTDPGTPGGNGDRYAQVGSIPVGMYPQDVVLSNSGARAYVTNLLSNSVSVIDTTTNNTVAVIPVSASPQKIAINPAGTRLYVTHLNRNTVTVIDTISNTVVTNVTIGFNPLGIAISPNGSRVYVANDDNTISVLDTATNVAVATIYGSVFPDAIAISPDGNRLFVGGSTARAGSMVSVMSVIDTTTNKTISTFDVPGFGGSWPVVISPNGERLYVGGVTGVIAVLDTRTGTVVSTIQVGTSSDLAVSPDGTRLYATSSAAKSVAVIDTATNTVVGSFQTINYPKAISVSPDSNRIYVAINGSSIDPVGADTVSVFTRSR